MERKATSTIVLTLLLISMLTLILNSNIQPARATGTIYIRADGSIDPPTANITLIDNVTMTYAFTDNNYDGIVIERDNIEVDGVGYTLQGSGTGTGFYLDSRTSITIYNVTVKGWGDGFLVNNTSNEITITENNITDCSIGVNIYDSSYYNSVYRNNITDNNWGVVVGFSDYNYMFENNVINNIDGMWIGPYANNNTFSDNNLKNNSRYGFFLYVAGDNELRGNIMVNNTYNFEVYGGEVGAQLVHYVNDVDRTNTVDGKPIYYWVSNQSGVVPSDAGYVALVNCTNITVENLNLTKNGKSIQLAWTSSSEITGNNITNSDYGIWLYSSNSNNITENNIENNDFYGIWVKSGSYNLVSENTVKKNKQGIMVYNAPLNTISRNNIANNQDHGVRLHSSTNNRITNNNISKNGPSAYGIWIFHCSYNNMSGNIIDSNSYSIYLQGAPSTDCKNNSIYGNNLSNGQYGIYLSYAADNTVYHNNFTDNTIHASVSPSKNNTWDDGYPSGGNFWNGYTDVDSYSGPYQNVTGSDGIWDNSYAIDGNNEDRYPFTAPTTEECAQYVYVTTKPNNQQGILNLVNVTAFNGSNVVASGISNTSGIVTLVNVPYGNITFVAYAKSDYSQVIANATVLISEESQSFDLICSQNYGESSISWNWIIVFSSSMLTISLPLSLLGFRMLIKKRRRNSESQPLKGSWQAQFPRRKTERRRVRK